MDMTCLSLPLKPPSNSPRKAIAKKKKVSPIGTLPSQIVSINRVAFFRRLNVIVARVVSIDTLVLAMENLYMYVEGGNFQGMYLYS